MICGHGRSNLPGIKTPILQETHLPGFFFEFTGQAATEFLQPNLDGEIGPVHIKMIKNLTNQTGDQAPTTQFLADSQWTFTLTDS